MSVDARPDDVPDTLPAKFWASTGGLIDPKPLGSSPASVTQVLDRLLIHEAFDLWSVGHDENRVDVVLSVLTEDVVLEYGIGTATPDFALHGRAEVEERLAPNFATMTGQRRHCISNVLIEFASDTAASAMAYGIVPRAMDGLDLHATVVYRGDLRKEADGYWRFSRFYVGCDALAGGGGRPLEDPPSA